MKKLYQILEKSDTKAGRLVDISLVLLIFINILIVIVDSYGSIRQRYEAIISLIELISITLFSIEYILRLIVSPFKYSETYKIQYIFRYLISPMAIIDILAILPFYLPMLLKFDFRLFRILRVFRLLRVLKFKRYSKALDIITSVFKNKKAELLLSTLILTIMIFFAGSLMYYAENETQPESFPNIIESASWSIKTMVFLGYNDSEPLTPFGSIMGMIIVVLGLGWLTLPISILSSGFIEEIHKEKCICPHCGKEI